MVDNEGRSDPALIPKLDNPATPEIKAGLPVGARMSLRNFFFWFGVGFVSVCAFGLTVYS
jgi:hypothetical protein